MSKIVKSDWRRFRESQGLVDLPNFTANLNRKLAVTAIREGGGSREDQHNLALHMAHSVLTADRYYDQSIRQKQRHAVMAKIINQYKKATVEHKCRATES